MIILIGGSASVGKTKLANDLMKKLHIPYISIDVLMMGIYRSNLKCGYTPMDTNETISRNIWPIVSEMIKTNIENNSKGIYEGFQILPNAINTFESKYKDYIYSYYLAFSEKYINKHYGEIEKHRSIIEQRTDLDSRDEMIERNAKIIKDCETNKQKICIIDRNYTFEINALLEMIVEDYNKFQLTIAST